ncbi:MAG: L-seryl-tRNA(Sec) selenium transferase [Alphaproteobacteria bacterium]|nr:L-seryl-tRNA(Sec) selenium transferase [Alphaproteobacteria bacterium]
MTTPIRPPSVDQALKAPELSALIDTFGRKPVVDGLRQTLDERRALLRDGEEADLSLPALAAHVEGLCRALLAVAPRPVFNLTGTVLHTNLGRAPLAEEAITAMTAVARHAGNLEFDLDSGKRGERDTPVAERLKRLTGAEDTLVVNNNAAAVLLLLNTLGLKREVPVSRGELIEIGGAFRMPDIMARAGCRLVEVGTTNRTYLRDFEQGLGPRTALLLKIHTSNYAIQGFTAEVAEAELAALAHQHDLPFAVDLGSGTLVDLSRWGLPKEPTVTRTLEQGADLVTFSGDKLLGGPQAGLIVGRRDLIAKLKKNPMKRAMRADKMTLAALDATLALYEDPDSLPRTLPALRLLTRPEDEITRQAARLAPVLQQALGEGFVVTTVSLKSQIGSGALPVESLPSAGLGITPAKGGRGADARLRRLAAALRALPRPVIGALRDGTLWLDLRCLDDEAVFADQLKSLTTP